VQQPHFFATAIRATRAVSVCVFSAVTAVTAVTVVGGSVWSVSSFAQEQSPEQAIAVQASPIDELSDEQLTNLAADWEQLDAAARADLIAETRDRMASAESLRSKQRHTLAEHLRTAGNRADGAAPLRPSGAASRWLVGAYRNSGG